MTNGTNTESAATCPPGRGESPDGSITRPPQFIVVVAVAAAIGALLGSLVGAGLARR